MQEDELIRWYGRRYEDNFYWHDVRLRHGLGSRQSILLRKDASAAGD